MMRRIGSFIPHNDNGDTSEAGDFKFKLSEAESSANEPSGESTEVSAGSKSSPATPEQIEQLFKRVSKPLEEQSGDIQDFALREKTLPPPKTGQRILNYFTPESEEGRLEGQLEKRELQVVRYLPEGEALEGVPHLSITFSRPMIAVGTLDEVKQQNVPVQLTPLPEGRWKWLGTKTITFEPKYRFPMSTKFDVVIPAGTKSIYDESMREDFKFSFTTPTVAVKNSWPSYNATRDTVIFLAFSQRIVPSAILNHISLEASGSESQKWKLVEVPKEEFLQKYKEAKSLISNAQGDDPEGVRWIAFRSEELLPYDSNVIVKISANAPSAEGPLLSKDARDYSFRTYGLFRIVDSDNYEPVPCSELRIRLSNAISDDSIVENDFRIERHSDGNIVQLKVGEESTDTEKFTVRAQGNELYFKGNTQRATYKFYLPQSLKDVFDQNLQPNQEATITVGPARPYFRGHRDGLFIQDITSDPIYPICTCNVKQVQLIVRRVSWNDFLNSHWSGTKHIPWTQTNDLSYWLGEAGEQIVDKILDIESHPDQYVITKIDLKQYLQYPEEGLGNIVVGIQPVDWEENKPRSTAWIQCTKLGLDVYSDLDRFIVWTNSLVDGSPVKARIWTQEFEGTTGDDGTAVVEWSNNQQRIEGFFASNGNDWTVLSQICLLNNSMNPHAIVHSFTDRNIYKPKENVHVKGYVRDVEIEDKRNYKLSISAGRSLQWTAHDARSVEIAKGTITLSRFGSFELNFLIPDNANLGHAYVSLTGDRISHSCAFQLQEFRKPESKISCSASSGPFFRNSSAVVTTQASYFSGGNLTDARVSWEVTARPSTYRPPGWSGYSFGENSYGYPYGHRSAPELTQNLSGKTDVTGSHYLLIAWEGAYSTPKPVTFTANSTIIDINNQTLSSSTSFIVHPSHLYVGLKKDFYCAQPNQAFPVKVVVTDIDGKAVSQVPVHISIKRLEPVWNKKSKAFKTKETEVSLTTLTSQEAPIEFAPIIDESGSYAIDIIVEDDKGFKNQLSSDFYVIGGLRSATTTNSEIKVLTDKENYAPGDTATITIISPFASASEGIYQIINNGIDESHRFKITDSFSIKIPITPKHIPNFQVIFDILSTQNSKAARAYVTQMINVPSSSYYALDVSVTPEANLLRPGGSTNLNVSVTKKSGEPAADAEIAIIVVDDAILSLTGYELPSAVDVFTPGRYSHSSSRHNRDHICVIDYSSLQPVFPAQTAPIIYPMMAKRKCAGGMNFMARNLMPMTAMACTTVNDMCEGADGGSGAAQTPIEVRSNFDPLALFASSVITNESGKASIPVKLPDSLTSYRIWAVVCWSTRHFGQAESSVVAQLPLSIRPSIPRFLNFGDNVVLNVVVSNQTEHVQEAVIGLKTTNFNLQTPGYCVTIEPQKRAVLGFSGSTARVGRARFQFAIASRDFADASEEDIPVWTPATTEAFATYGELTDKEGVEKLVLQPVLAPSDKAVFVQFGGIEVTTSSTALSSLADAFIYLQKYPFECTEQITSRAMATIALKDVLKAFKVPDLPSDSEIQNQLESDIKRLAESQRRDGGYGWWKGSNYSSPYLTIHVAHFIQRAQVYGIELPPSLNLAGLKNYLKQINQYFDSYYDEYYKNSLKAYSLYVLHRFKELSKEEAVTLYQTSKDRISLESLAWLLVAINDITAPESQEILRKIESSVVETAETITFNTQITDTGKYLFLESARRTDGIILEALLDVNQKTDMATKIVKGLLAHKKKGRWGNTQENLFIILALRKYFDIFEANEPDFSASIWLDSKLAGEQSYKGRSPDSHITKIPMRFIASSEPSVTRNIAIAKEGDKGVLYYRIGMDYAPSDLKIKERDEGFEIKREYEAIDDPAHVRYDNETGTWHFKAGERIRVRLTLTNTSRRYHVALVDKLPAGLEAVNPSLKTSEKIPRDPQEATRGYWWRSTWFEHQNFRDERVEAFASLLHPGAHKYSYIARVTSKGTFVLPPATAEEMYSPEIFGRCSSERVVVS